MHINQLENTMGKWIAALHHYPLAVLQAKPDKNSWSLGQVYLHLIADTHFYIGEAAHCLQHPEHQSEKMHDFAAGIFANNEFPDAKIEGDAGASMAIPQPDSKAELLEQMNRLQASLIATWSEVAISRNYGKTKHPGLGFFDAREWLLFAEMHMRHHLRQKARIERALGLPQVL